MFEKAQPAKQLARVLWNNIITMAAVKFFGNRERSYLKFVFFLSSFRLPCSTWHIDWSAHYPSEHDRWTLEATFQMQNKRLWALTATRRFPRSIATIGEIKTLIKKSNKDLMVKLKRFQIFKKSNTEDSGNGLKSQTASRAYNSRSK